MIIVINVNHFHTKRIYRKGYEWEWMYSQRKKFMFKNLYIAVNSSWMQTILLFLSYFFHGVLLLYNNMQKWWCLLRELAIIEYFLRCHFSTLSLALFNLSFLHYGSCLVHSGWQNPTSAGFPGITLFLNDFQHLLTRKKRIATGKSKKRKPGACRGLSKPGPTPCVFAPKTHEASW